MNEKLNGWQSLGYDSYESYLLSELWQQKKEAAIKWRNNQCELCGSMKFLEVHHTSYEFVGNERLRDLLVVCKFCHRQIHEEMKNYERSNHNKDNKET